MRLVLPLIMLALSARCQDPGIQKVRFGARFKQHKSFCRDRINCQFGYNFPRQLKDNLIPESESGGSDFREIVFIPPTTQVTPPPVTLEQVTPQWQHEAKKTVQRNVKRRRFLINFDPRRKQNSSKSAESKHVKVHEKIRKQDIKDETNIKDDDTITKEDVIFTKENDIITQNDDTITNVDENAQVLITTEASVETTTTVKRTLRNRNRKLRKQTLTTKKPLNSFFREETPVTIKIGGASIVIPNFKLLPQKLTNFVDKETDEIRQPKPQRLTQKKTKTRKSELKPNLPQSPNRIRTQPTIINSDISYQSNVNSSAKQGNGKTELKTRKYNRKFEVPVSKKPSISRQNNEIKNVKFKSPPSRLLDPSDEKSGVVKPCPGNLEVCVDGCANVDDVYAYSACIVECSHTC